MNRTYETHIEKKYKKGMNMWWICVLRYRKQIKIEDWCLIDIMYRWIKKEEKIWGGSIEKLYERY